MDKQDFQEQDFMEILMRLPWSLQRLLRLKASIHVYGRDHTRIRRRAKGRYKYKMTAIIPSGN